MAQVALERIVKLTVQGNQAVRQLKKINTATTGIYRGFQNLQRAVGGAIAVMGSFRAVQGIVAASDQVKLLEGSFEALTGSGARASDMLQRVYRTVSDTGANMKDVGTTFQRLTVGLEELGATNAQVDAVANTFIKLGRVSGTSMHDTNAALVQFSQGLASGKLQGDELRSIMERLPLITKLIQQEWNRVNGNMKITRGEVKQMGRDGKLSAELIANALLNGAELTAKQFEALTFTLEQEQNRLFASLTRAMAEFADASGLDDAVKDSVKGLSDAVDDLTRNVGSFTRDITSAWRESGVFRVAVSLLASAFLYKLAPAIAATTKAMLKNPATVFLAATLIAVPLIVSNWDRIVAYFKYKLPSAFSAAAASFNNFMSELMTFIEGERTIENDQFLQLADVYSQKSLEYAKLWQLEIIKIEAVADKSRNKDPIEIFHKDVHENIMRVRAGMVYLASDLGKYAEKVKDAIDPIRQMEREWHKVQIAIEAGGLTRADGERYMEQFIKGIEDKTKGIPSMFEEIKDAINGFVSDFTNTIVDGLAEGEMAFKNFVEEALKTLAKLFLNRMFTQVVDLIPIAGVQSLAPVTTAGITQFGGGGQAMSTVGLLQSPEYGFGATQAGTSGTTVNVYNNAGVEVETTEKRTSRGLEIDILIERQINKSIVGGGLDKSMSSAFGIRRMAF